VSDRYVIVYRDGSRSLFSETPWQAESIRAAHLRCPRKPGDGLAYRIRCREKASGCPYSPGGECPPFQVCDHCQLGPARTASRDVTREEHEALERALRNGTTFEYEIEEPSNMPVVARLDASRALYEVTGRRAPAGAEK
jgi:hypothetical protein